MVTVPVEVPVLIEVVKLAELLMVVMPVKLSPPVPCRRPVPELTPTAVTAPPLVTTKLVKLRRLVPAIVPLIKSSQPAPMLMAVSVPDPGEVIVPMLIPLIVEEEGAATPWIFKPFTVICDVGAVLLTIIPFQVQAPVTHPVKVGAATLYASISLVPAPVVLMVEATESPEVIPPLLALVDSSAKIIFDTLPISLRAVWTYFVVELPTLNTELVVMVVPPVRVIAVWVVNALQFHVWAKLRESMVWSIVAAVIEERADEPLDPMQLVHALFS